MEVVKKVYCASPAGSHGTLYSNLKKAYLKYCDYCKRYERKPYSYSIVNQRINEEGTFVDRKGVHYSIWQRNVF